MRTNIIGIMVIGLLTTLLFTGNSTHAQASCDVGDFKSRDFGTLSDAEKTFRLATMTEEEFNALKRKGGGSIGYAGFSIGGSFGEMKQNVRAIARASNIRIERGFQKSWNQSLLTENDLLAYRACLQSQQGFHTSVEGIGERSLKLRIIWTPGGAAGIPAVVDHLNFTSSSISTLREQIGSEPWGSRNYSLEVFMQRSDLTEISQITLRLGNRSVVLHMSAAPVQLTVPTGVDFRPSQPDIDWDYNIASPDTHFRCKRDGEIINEVHNCHAHGLCGDSIAVRKWCKRRYE